MYSMKVLFMQCYSLFPVTNHSPQHFVLIQFNNTESTADVVSNKTWGF